LYATTYRCFDHRILNQRCARCPRVPGWMSRRRSSWRP
jgi:hypothetical protein